MLYVEVKGGEGRVGWWELVCVSVLTVVIWLSTAWVADDGFIVFRVVRNLVGGEGLVWNLGHRVQVFTDPLWVLVLGGVSLVFGEPEVVAYWLSLALAVATVLSLFLFLRRSSASAAWLAVLALLGSPACMYFLSSGLETPLLGLLLVSYARSTWNEPDSGGLLAAAIVLTRPDALVLLAPLLYRGCRQGNKRRLLVMFGVPLFLWLAFATLYFGTPVPNTFWAKVAHGAPPSAVAYAGLLYLARNAVGDPTTSLLLVAVGVALHERRPGWSWTNAWGLGVCLHVAYVVLVGGDYYMGRFVYAPMVVSVAIVGRCATRRSSGLWFLSGSLVAGVVCAERSPLRDATAVLIAIDKVYQRTDRLRGWKIPMRSEPPPPLAVSEARRRAVLTESAGLWPYLEPPETLFVDTYAICDPLLARMPGRYERAGHASRAMPEGYLEVLSGQAEHIDDRSVDSFYQHLARLHTGPLFSRSRAWSILYVHLQMPVLRTDIRRQQGIPAPPPLDHADKNSFLRIALEQ